MCRISKDCGLYSIMGATQRRTLYRDCFTSPTCCYIEVSCIHPQDKLTAYRFIQLPLCLLLAVYIHVQLAPPRGGNIQSGFQNLPEIPYTDILQTLSVWNFVPTFGGVLCSAMGPYNICIYPVCIISICQLLLYMYCRLHNALQYHREHETLSRMFVLIIDPVVFDASINLILFPPLICNFTLFSILTFKNWNYADTRRISNNAYKAKAIPVLISCIFSVVPRSPHCWVKPLLRPSFPINRYK